MAPSIMRTVDMTVISSMAVALTWFRMAVTFATMVTTRMRMQLTAVVALLMLILC